MKKLLFLLMLTLFINYTFGQGNWTLSTGKNRWANGMGFGIKDTASYLNGSDTNILIVQYPGILCFRHLTTDHWQILETFSSGGGYIPYTGATADVNLGIHALTTTGTVTSGDLNSNGNLTALSGFFAMSATGNVASASNTSSIGSGTYGRGGSNRDKSPFFVAGYNGDSIINATLGGVFIFKPVTVMGAVNATTFSGSGANLTSIPNGALVNNSITITAGAGLSGGGTVALGGSVALANTGITSLTAANGVSITGSTIGLGNITPSSVSTSGALTVTGKISGGSLTITGNSATGSLNVSGTAAINGTLSIGDLSVAGDIIPDADAIHDFGAVSRTWLNGYFSNIVGKLSTGAQPNITSLGTLSNLTVSGSITASGGIQFPTNGNLVAGSVVKTASQGLVAQGITGSAYDAALLNAAGTFYVYRVPTGTNNIDLPGNTITFGNGSSIVNNNLTITDVTASGTVTAINFSGPGTRLTGTATGLSIGGNAATATTAGTVTTAAQPNITSLGALSSLTVTGNIAFGTLSTSGLMTANGGITLGTPGNFITGNTTSFRVVNYAQSANNMIISDIGVVTIPNLGTGAVQATSGVLSVVSDRNVKDDHGKFSGSALSALMKIPKPAYWNFNEKSRLPKETWNVRQFGLYADSVHAVLGEEFAPTQPKSKADSATSAPNYGLSDRALLSLTIQALQEANNKIDALDAHIKELEKKKP